MKTVTHVYLFCFLICLQIHYIWCNGNLIRAGNYWICDLSEEPNSTCEINHSYDTRIYYVCPHYENYTDKYCFINNGPKNVKEFSLKVEREPIETKLPGVVFRKTNVYSKNNIYFSAPFYIKQDMQIVCVCPDINNKEKTTSFVKINLKKNGRELIKGCDFGNNINEKQFLTNSLPFTSSGECPITAGPGEVIGINCLNYDSFNNSNVFLIPEEAFFFVYVIFKDAILAEVSIDTILPGAKPYPEFIHSFDINKGFRKYSTTAYLALPEKIDKEFKMSVHCTDGSIFAFADFTIKTSNV